MYVCSLSLPVQTSGSGVNISNCLGLCQMSVNVTNQINGTTGTINQVLILGLLNYQIPILPGSMYDTTTGTTTVQSISIAVINADTNRTYSISVTANGPSGSGITRNGTSNPTSQTGMSSFTLGSTINLTGITTLTIVLDVDPL
jgi:hypothetical protein